MSVEQSYTAPGPDEPELLRRFGIGADQLLGSGGEARVFALDRDRVLRILSPSSEPEESADAINALLASWSGINLGFALPRVLEQGRWDVQRYTIEARMPGLDGGRWLARVESDQRRRAGLMTALEAATRLAELPLPRSGPGRPWQPEARFSSPAELYAAQIEISLGANRKLLAALVPDLIRQQANLLHALSARRIDPAFVHGDLAPANLIFSPDGRLGGVLDVSVHSLVADPVLDLVGLVAFVELTPYPHADADAAWLEARLAEHLGADAWLIDAYRRYYALYYAMDDQLLPWCAAQLNRRPAF
ncbi:MAG: aminoglycoside phosphotransferase family protein [Micropruina sp.]|nr:aminoglycoside phosphotransferase family protein [Micropruina sp.]